MAAVMAEKFPNKAPQLLAYLWRIICASRNFWGSAWAAYDWLYRRQALVQSSLDWAQENSALNNEAFVGHAKVIMRCRHCVSEHHTTETYAWNSCNLIPLGPPNIPRPRVVLLGNMRRCAENCTTIVASCTNASMFMPVSTSCGPHPVSLCGTMYMTPRHSNRAREHSPVQSYQDRLAH